MDIIKKINKASSLLEILPTLSVHELESAIELAADSYYNDSHELISDEYYDILIAKLKKINPNSRIFKNIGAPIKEGKVKLPYWMGSMDKNKGDKKTLDKWLSIHKGDFVISDKLDGISCLIHNDGKNINLYTRGNGSFGKNVTHLLNYINIIVDGIGKNVAIRGELIISKENFKKFSEK